MTKGKSARDPNITHTSKSIGLCKTDSRTRQDEALNFPLILKGHLLFPLPANHQCFGEIKVPSSGNVEG